MAAATVLLVRNVIMASTKSKSGTEPVLNLRSLAGNVRRGIITFRRKTDLETMNATMLPV